MDFKGYYSIDEYGDPTNLSLQTPSKLSQTKIVRSEILETEKCNECFKCTDKFLFYGPTLSKLIMKVEKCIDSCEKCTDPKAQQNLIDIYSKKNKSFRSLLGYRSGKKDPPTAQDPIITDQYEGF